jgi:hypothetical protein
MQYVIEKELEKSFHYGYNLAGEEMIVEIFKT